MGSIKTDIQNTPDQIRAKKRGKLERERDKPMRLTIIGSGYVGLVAAACFAELGHQVTCVDNDRQKIERLRAGKLPIYEDFLPELLAKYRGRRLHFTTELAEALADCLAVFIAVGTPSTQHGEADLSCVEEVSRAIARSLDGYKVVVEKSTVPVLTHDWVRKVMLMNGAAPGSFDVASNPEFLREGHAVTDFLYPDRIVLGVGNERSSAILHEIYEPLASGRYYQNASRVPGPAEPRIPPIIVTSPKSAELIKHACNAFLATKVSFINAVANVCEAVGADIEQVCEGIGTDSRIGKKFLNPGIGYGGSCFPKDLVAFHTVARECGYDFRLLEEVSQINREQLRRFVRKVKASLWTLRGKKLAVLGLSFKGGTDDMRESPALGVVELLLCEGCEVRAYDPAAMGNARRLLPEQVSYAANPYEAATGADALLILNDWKEFAALDLKRLRAVMTYPIVVDGRNLYDPAVMSTAGFIYHSIGRPPVLAERRVEATPVAGITLSPRPSYGLGDILAPTAAENPQQPQSQ
jgi:UDPglucose 6-dehydrogenase